MDIDELGVGEALRARVAAGGHTTDVWPVRDGVAPAVLVVSPGGATVLGPEGDRVFRWPEVSYVRAEVGSVGFRSATAPTMARFALTEPGHGREILEAVARYGGPVAPAQAGPTEAQRARRTLNQALGTGIVLQLLAALVLGVDTASAVVGLLLAAAGGLLTLLAVVGWGVVLGIRAAREPVQSG